MTNQQIFDKVLSHLREQGTASVDARGFCMYRGDGGRMCAVGCLIPDGAYSPEIESKEVAILPNEVLSAAGIDPTDDDQVKLCGCLQVAHDRYLADMGLDAWEDEMCEIANEFGLIYTPPKD